MSALGSLVVKLGLEYAEYTGGLSKTEQAAMATAKKVQDTFDGMQRKVAATVGAIAGGLAAGFAVGAFKNLLAGVVETGARLDDLRMQTGETVEALSGLLAVGKYNDVGADQLGAMMQKLSTNLAGATEESKGASKALQALGIDMDAFKRQSPAEQMQEIARGLAKFEDGAGKSAVAIALLGKEGANALPFFNDLATVGELQATVTTEQAAAAANLDDNLARLSATGEGWKKELVSGMVPALDLGAQALLDVMNGTGGMREEVKRLAADGSIREWTKNAITGLTYVADAAEYAWRALKSIGKGFGGLAAGLVLALQGDFRGAFNALKDSGQEMIDAFGGETMGARLRARMADIEATGQVAEAAKPKLDFSNVIDKTGKAAKEAKNPVDALIESIDKRTTQFAAELSAEEKLTEGEKLAIDVLEQLRSGKVKVTEAESALIGKRLEALLAVEKEVKAHQAAAQALEAERAARVKARQSMEEGAAALLQSNEELEREIELIGLTERQQLQVLRARNEAIILTKRATLAELERRDAISGTMSREQIALATEIEQLERRNQLLEQRQVRQEEFTAWQSMWQSIDQTAHDVFVNVFEDGAGTFKRLGQTLKASLLDLLYQLTIKQWIINISANFTGGGVSGLLGALLGGGGGGDSAGGGFGLGDLFSKGSSLYNMISNGFSGAISTAFSSFAMSPVGQSLGLSAMGAGGMGPPALTATGSAIGGAMPYLAGAGLGYGLGSMISGGYSAIGKGGYAANIGGTAIGMILGGPIGAIIGGALGGVVNRLFGRKLSDWGIEGTLGGESGFEGRQFQYYKGGLFRSDKTKYSELDEDVRKSIADTFKSIQAEVGTFATVLGLDASKIADFTTKFKFSTKGLDDAGIQEAFANALRTGSNELAQQVLGTWERTTKEVERVIYGGISDNAIEDVTGVIKETVEELRYIPSEFARDGEEAIDTLTRLATSLTAVNAVFENLGYTLFESSLAGADMASQLMDLLGGAEGFNKVTGSFFQNYYSPEAQREAVRRQIESQLRTVDLSMPDINTVDARDQYKALAEAQDLSTEAGREAWAMLMQLSEAFASITVSAEQAATMRFDLNQRLLTAEGKEREALLLRREQEYEALLRVDPELAAMVRRIYELEDAAQAEAEAEREKERARQERRSREDAALDALRRAVAAERTVLESARSDAQQAAQLWRSIVGIAHEAVVSLRSESAATAAMQAAQGWVFIEDAVASVLRGGAAPDADALREAITAARGGLSEENYASQWELERDRAMLAGLVEQLEAGGTKQLSAADQAVDLLNKQITRLDDQLEYWEEQLKLARGELDALISVDAAVRAIADLLAGDAPDDAPAAKPPTTGGGAGGPVFGGGGRPVDQEPARYHRMRSGGTAGVMYEGIRDESLIDRLDKLSPVYHSFDGTRDLVGLAEAFKAAGGTIADLSILSGNWESDWRKAFAAVGIPAFARGGEHTGGWALVGEQGPELAYMPPARIYTASQTAQMLGRGGEGQWASSKVETMLQRLIASVDALGGEASAVSLREIRDVLAGASEGPYLRMTQV